MLKPEIATILHSIETREDLSEAFAILKRNWTMLDVKAAIQFQVGDEVTWTGKNGKQTGKIVRVNQKSLAVDVPSAAAFGGYVHWKVSPTTVKKV